MKDVKRYNARWLWTGESTHDDSARVVLAADYDALAAELKRWQHGSAIRDQALTDTHALIQEQVSGFVELEIARHRVAELEAENERLHRLAYIGEHEFEDCTYKARVDELRAELAGAQVLIGALAQIVPLDSTLGALETGRTMVDYFKGLHARAALAPAAVAVATPNGFRLVPQILLERAVYMLELGKMDSPTVRELRAILDAGKS